jgi:hypothetical protein
VINLANVLLPERWQVTNQTASSERASVQNGRDELKADRVLSSDHRKAGLLVREIPSLCIRP